MGLMDFLFITNYLRGLLARASESGWRRLWGFGGGLLCFKLVYFAAIEVPERGLSVPDGFYVFILGFCSLYVSTFIVRAVEKDRERKQTHSPTGGLVNNNAIAPA